MHLVKYRPIPRPQPAANEARSSRLGRSARAAQGRIDGAGLALSALLRRRALRRRTLLSLRERASRQRPGREIETGWRFRRWPAEHGGEWPPFRTFGDLYYTYQVSLDLKVEEGFAIRTEPHPRFYTDPTNTTPIAVPALIRRWWPMLYFLVFKSPPEGATHVFRPGEPFVQILILPEEADLDLVPMSEEEAAERELQSRRIFESRSTLSAETEWTSATDTVFDGTYRHILGAATEKAKRRR